jgi:hypothetical protein
MVIVEHFPEIVIETIKKNPATFEWFTNDWIKLVVSNPETRKMSLLKKDVFIDYKPLETQLEKLTDVDRLIESTEEVLPIYLINKN